MCSEYIATQENYRGLLTFSGSLPISDLRGAGYLVTLIKHLDLQVPEILQTIGELAKVDEDTRLFGSTQDLYNKKNKLVFELIKWTQEIFGVSFLDLTQAREVFFQGSKIRDTKEKELASYYQQNEKMVESNNEPFIDVNTVVPLSINIYFKDSYGYDKDSYGYDQDKAVRQIESILIEYENQLEANLTQQVLSMLSQLKELVKDERLFGRSSNNSALQNKIIFQLNKFLLRWTGKYSFIDFATKNLQ